MAAKLFRPTNRGKVSKVWHCEFYANGKRHQRSTKCTDKRAAEKVAADMERDAADPETAKAKGYTLGKCCDDYLALLDSKARRKAKLEAEAHAKEESRRTGKRVAVSTEWKKAKARAGTVRFYKAKHKKLRAFFGDDAPLSGIEYGGPLCWHYADEADDATDPHTVTHELRALRSALNWAADRGYYKRPSRKFFPKDWDDGYEPGQTWVRPDEFDRVLDAIAGAEADKPRTDRLGRVQRRRRAADAPRRAAHLAFVIATGARAAEAERACLADITLYPLADVANGVHGVVRMRGTKTKKSKGEIPILEHVRPLIERVLRDAPRDDPDAPMFDAWAPGSRSRDMGRACRDAGIVRVTLTDLRRSAGKWLRLKGVGYDMIGDFLRHASGEMARKVYANLDGNGADMGAAIVAQIGNAASPPLRLVEGGKAQAEPAALDAVADAAE